MIGVSVIVCCYNSASRLPETIKHLALQNVDPTIAWEIIIVNNNSSDNTTEVAKKEWNKYNLSVPFSIIDEARAGLSFAREAGIVTSKYNYLVFCDDDNWLFEDYVNQVFKIMSSNSSIGMLGGVGYPVTDSENLELLHKFSGDFATGPQGIIGTSLDDITESKGYVYGAGAVLRKEALLELKKKKINYLLTDRIGNNLASGGDVELAFYIRMLKFRIFYSDSLRFHHFLPKNRITWSYIKRLHYSFGLSSSLYIIPDIYFKNPRKQAYKYSTKWLFMNASRNLLKKIIISVIKGDFSKDYQKCLIDIINQAGYCRGLLINYKKNRMKYVEMREKFPIT